MPQVTGADILTRARSYLGKFTDGPDVPMMAMAIARAFPDMRMEAYARLANNSTAWCAIFCFYVLSQFGIRPPYDEPMNETDDWMFANSPLIAKWGTEVSRDQARPGDLAVLPTHITFFDGDAGGGYFWGLGGNQGDAVTRARFAWSQARFVRPPGASAAAPAPAPAVTNATADQLSRMAKAIIDYEARRDSQGRLQVYEPPANDGGGAYEVAGINERYHPDEAAKLRALIEAGQHDEAERRARAYILSITDVAAGWHRDIGVQFFNRDGAFNRGPTGAAKIFQMALKTDVHGQPLEIDGDVGPLTLGAAAAAKNASDLITRLRAAREAYEREVVGYRANFWNGLVNRWNYAEAAARKFSAETPQSEPPMPDPNVPATPGPTLTIDLEKMLETISKLMALFAALKGGQAALPPPAPAPAPEPPPTTTPPPKTGFGTGILGLLLTVALNAFGVVGSPVGPEATPTGQLLPAIFGALTGLGATGKLDRWIGVIKTVIGAFKPKTTP